MNALFALALLVSPSQAGVVMPVESGVAPAGPSMTGIPVLAPAGGSYGLPSLGAALDLRGGLPLLPSPVPGLLGPSLNFVGNTPEAAAVKSEAAAAQITPAPATTLPSRAADKTPALPAKTSPGAPSPAISLDRRATGSLPENRLSNTLAQSPALEHVQPEKAAGLGRSFFDQSNENRRGVLENPSGTASGASAGRTGRHTVSADGSGLSDADGTEHLAPRDAGVEGNASGSRHGRTQNLAAYVPEGETLHDAVAAPGAVAGAGGGAVKPFGSIAPNGDLAAAAGSAVLPVLGAPRPLALDLSRSGLIVRVRSALNDVINSPAQESAAIPRLLAPGPSTSLIERGAMLEAFTVANAYADSVSVVRPMAAGAFRAASRLAPPSPASESSPAPLWWAWFALPLFVAAIRGIL